MTDLDTIGYGRPDALYELLPVIVRQLDAGRGHPLRDLLRVLGEQVAVVEDGIAALGDEPFIETCSDASVPLIGELVGWTPVADAGLAALGTPGRDLARGSVLVPRRDVANTVRHRRRKGTLAVLEELARDVAGWPAHAVEHLRVLAYNQHVEHVRTGRGRVVDVRAGGELERLGGAFDTHAHVVDVRRGGPTVAGVTVFVWRLGSYSMTDAPAAQAEHIDGPHVFTFDPLYHDVPLFVAPSDTARPVPLTRRMLAHPADDGGPSTASPLYYGPGAGLSITAHDWPRRGVSTVVPAEQVRPADLGEWRRYRAEPGTVAVDPERGRMLFRPGQAPSSVTVTYHYGFPADLGGGEYDRVRPGPTADDRFSGSAADGRELAAVLAAWRAAAPRHGVIELTSTDIYDAGIGIDLADGQELVIRAANRVRPIVWLPDRRPDRADSLAATLAPGSRLVLDGLTFTGRAVRITGGWLPEGQEPPCATTRVTMRHCTVVPGRVPPLEHDAEPPPPALELADLDGAVVDIGHCVVGSILVSAAPHTEPVDLRITDSVVDALRPEHEAIGCPGDGAPPVSLTLARATVRGTVVVHDVPLVENAILLGELAVARRRTGCVRFSWVEPGSCTPRRFRCQPDLVIDALGVSPAPGAVASEIARVRPRFTDTTYGEPGWFQLARDVAPEVWRGADDDAEIGAYHDLYQPQREANLVARLAEYTPAGMTPGLVVVT